MIDTVVGKDEAAASSKLVRNLILFQQVTIDPIVRTLSWPNGADFDAETLRHWPEYKDELASRAQSWEQVLA